MLNLFKKCPQYKVKTNYTKGYKIIKLKQSLFEIFLNKIYFFRQDINNSDSNEIKYFLKIRLNNNDCLYGGECTIVFENNNKIDIKINSIVRTVSWDASNWEHQFEIDVSNYINLIQNYKIKLIQITPDNTSYNDWKSYHQIIISNNEGLSLIKNINHLINYHS